jgi:GTPase involved in cell partitioning and DNA repair
MELKAARTELNAKPKTITLDKIEKEIEKEGQKIFYFDRENSHKDLMEMVEHFEEKGLSVYFREIRYGLDENDYLYEVHILA